MIVIIDYGMGNPGSLENMIRKAGAQSIISGDPEVISKAEKLILPGVGAFDNAMSKLSELLLLDVLNRKVLKECTPILCICLGAQLVTKSSEEGKLPGLGWIDGVTRRFTFPGDTKLKVPHMGWNDVVVKKESPLFKEMYDEPSFYFVHSYYITCFDIEDILTTTTHGNEFTSSLQHKNIFATQFHPEKSHKYGLKLISNFVELKAC